VRAKELAGTRKHLRKSVPSWKYLRLHHGNSLRREHCMYMTHLHNWRALRSTSKLKSSHDWMHALTRLF